MLLKLSTQYQPKANQVVLNRFSTEHVKGFEMNTPTLLNASENATMTGDYFAAMYSNPAVLWSSIAVYLAGYIGFAILAAVLWFERSGMAGGYRTLNNQLTSFLIEQIMIFYGFCLGIDAIRAVFGPLNPKLCTLQIIVKNVVYSNFGVAIFSITIVKFWFICICKAVPTVDDNFFATYIYITSYTINGLACAAKFYGPGVPVLNQLICSGAYYPNWKKMQKPFPFDIYICLLCLLGHLSLSVPIFVQKRKIREREIAQTAIAAIRRPPTDFDALITRLMTGLLLLITLIMSYFLLTIDPENHGNAISMFGLYGNYFWAPSMIMFSLASMFLIKYKKLREAIGAVLLPTTTSSPISRTT